MHLGAIVAFVLALLVSPPASPAASVAGCPVFPPDNVWNTPVDQLPVDPSSAAYIATIGPDKALHPDFGSGSWNGGPIGIPYALVPGTQPLVPLTFDYADESDPGPYPIPVDAPIEGGASSSGDRHVLVVDRDHCVLYETFASYPQPDGSWHAGSGAVFDLRSHALRPRGWTSADAAGLPIFAGLVRYDEVAAGAINHALRFTAPQTQRRYVWPARHYASSLTGASYPPLGKRFRLKAAFDISAFSPESQVILRALKTYGMILADNGSAWYLSGAPDPRWDDDLLVSEFRRLKGSDFEAVDETPLLVSPDSGQARQAGPAPRPPEAAVLISPSGAVTTTTPTYRWNAVAAATLYYLQVRDGAGSTRVVTYTAAAAGCGSGSGVCAATPGTVLAPGAFQWSVQTWSADGFGPWSAGLSFTVAGPPPRTPTSLRQYAANGTTPIATGGRLPAPTVVFKGTVRGADAGQQARLEVEYRPVGTAFGGAVSCRSALVASGTVASCSTSGLLPGQGYHWRARAVDSRGAASAWVSYGGNSETAVDFRTRR